MAWVIVQGIPFGGGGAGGPVDPGYGIPLPPSSPPYPSPPIYHPPHPSIPLFPTNPIVIPPGSLGGGQPENPIVIPPWPPYVSLPIVYPPEATHPIVLPPSPGVYPAVLEEQIGDHPDKPDPAAPGRWILVSLGQSKVAWAWCPTPTMLPPAQPKK